MGVTSEVQPHQWKKPWQHTNQTRETKTRLSNDTWVRAVHVLKQSLFITVHILWRSVDCIHVLQIRQKKVTGSGSHVSSFTHNRNQNQFNQGWTGNSQSDGLTSLPVETGQNLLKSDPHLPWEWSRRSFMFKCNCSNQVHTSFRGLQWFWCKKTILSFT